MQFVDNHNLSNVDLGFCTLTLIDLEIIEVIAKEGIVLTEEMFKVIRAVAQTMTPFSTKIMINRTNHYSLFTDTKYLSRDLADNLFKGIEVALIICHEQDIHPVQHAAYLKDEYGYNMNVFLSRKTAIADLRRTAIC